MRQVRVLQLESGNLKLVRTIGKDYLSDPCDLAIDSVGNFFVADSGNDHIQASLPALKLRLPTLSLSSAPFRCRPSTFRRRSRCLTTMAIM
jgi:hypothetical protein